jgi:hypothetical protein
MPLTDIEFGLLGTTVMASATYIPLFFGLGFSGLFIGLGIGLTIIGGIIYCGLVE